MRISFNQNDLSNTAFKTVENGVKDNAVSTARLTGNKKNVNIAAADFVKGEDFDPLNTNPDGKKKKSIVELQKEAENMDVSVQQNYMTVMSNILSDEDYEKLSEDGFDMSEMGTAETVTIVDKIKAEMAKSGQIVEGFNDDLDSDVLTDVFGSEVLARNIEKSFKEADIPLTDENISDVAKAWEYAKSLELPDDNTMAYMLDNELSPEIWNMYVAQNSGMTAYSGSGAASYQDLEALKGQIDKVIEASNLPVNDESRRVAEWMLSNGLPLTRESLDNYNEISTVRIPVEEEKFAKEAAQALSIGKSAIHANLSELPHKNIYEQANSALQYYNDDSNFKDLPQGTEARIKLEEIRLRMTAEVNVKLIKSGFSIDTAPMEELLRELRKAEYEVADSLFSNRPDSVEKYETFTEANRIIDELPTLPAAVLGGFAVRTTETTLLSFHAEGVALKATYERAGESYEALMTRPDREYGDSIKKAFANVDDIVSDLGYELNEENRKAVRILGYNSMEMTAENIDRVAAADEKVKTVVEKMTPAVTLKMIRDGINPLEASFDELNEYFDNTEESFAESSEKYSRFLYNLERNNEISEQERDAYVGIYRMLRQIEKSDGAAVGALVNAQAELNFENLMSAVRSSKNKGIDVKLSDAFGTVKELIKNGKSITEEIAKGFVKNVDDVISEFTEIKEITREYYKEELERARQAASVRESSAELLRRGEIDETAENLLAAQELLYPEESIFSKLDKRHKRDRENPERHIPDMSERLDDVDAFKEEYNELIEGISKEIEDSILYENGSIDVRNMKLMHKQLSIAKVVSDREDYVIPMYIGEELSQVHLTIDNRSAGQGSVYIDAKIGESMNLEGRFSVSRGELYGAVTGNLPPEVMDIGKLADIFTERIENSQSAIGKIKVDTIAVVDKRTFSGMQVGTDATDDSEGAENRELFELAKIFLNTIKEVKNEN
ncbi:MAG: hypothetical protein IJ608_11385 [Lachnospiraceae bacterium]|nr:hypothetical protein [Lachnospiraceae bacterium]